MSTLAERRQIVGNMRRQVQVIEELFADYDNHWNGPDEEPIDVDPDGELGRALARFKRALEVDDEMERAPGGYICEGGAELCAFCQCYRKRGAA